jgi:hypothetical protein
MTNSNPIFFSKNYQIPAAIGLNGGFNLCPISGCPPTINFSRNFTGNPFGVGVPIDGTPAFKIRWGYSWPPYIVSLTMPTAPPSYTIQCDPYFVDKVGYCPN